MEIFNKILHSYAKYCRKEMVKILKCYLIPKKVMALCLRVQYFLANPVFRRDIGRKLPNSLGAAVLGIGITWLNLKIHSRRRPKHFKERI